MTKELLNKMAWEAWEKDAVTNPNPVNPHAFSYGYRIGFKACENKVELERPKIFLLGIEIPNHKEAEIISHSELGFNVNIIYSSKEYPLKKIHNVTEVHYLFHSLVAGEKQVAFESNIHFTGFTRNVACIGVIEITEADKLYENYWD